MGEGGGRGPERSLHRHGIGQETMMSATMTIRETSDDDYQPRDTEPFMNERQQAYFKKKLQDWRDDILRQSRDTIDTMQADSLQLADPADRASSESDHALELRTRDRQRKLIAKIDSALRRIEAGEYGYCTDTGEPISLRRLEARPTATLSLEAQERHERREKVHRDD